MNITRTSCCLIAILELVLARHPLRADDRFQYWAWNAAGEVVESDRLQGWADSRRHASFADTPIFAAERPLRVLHNRRNQTLLSSSSLLMSNGDVLPGEVVRYVVDRASSLPPHFVVELPAAMQLSAGPPALVRVRASEVRQIAGGNARPASYQSNRVLLKDGRVLSARSLRWIEQGVRVLTSEGVVDAAWREILQLDAPGDLMEGVLRETRGAAGASQELIGRLTTRHGAELTFRPTMMTRDIQTAPSRRQFASSTTDAFAIQPGWAWNAIVLRLDDLVFLNCRRENEIPLSLLPLASQRWRTGLNYWPWQRNRGVKLSLLQVGDWSADLGLGAHSHSELAFELPPHGNQFTTWVGIDRSADGGGCAKCLIYKDEVAGQPLWESGLLMGGQSPTRVGPLDIQGARQLVLVTQFADQQRPPGADPLDIRDHVAWLLPTVTLEPLDALVASGELATWIPQLEGWRLSPEDRERLTLRPAWNREETRWEMATQVDEDAPADQAQPYTLRRKLDVTLQNARFLIQVCGEHEYGRRDRRLQSHNEVSVWVNGEHLPTTMNGDLKTNRQGRDGSDRLWLLSQYVGKEIDLAIRVDSSGSPQERTSGMVWRQVALSPIVADLPADGRPIRPEAPLTSLTPVGGDRHELRQALQPGKLTNGEPLRIYGLAFDEGFGMPTSSQVTFELQEDWRRFVAIIGLADGWQGAGPYEILLDDQPHWRCSEPSSFGRDSSARQIDIPIPGGRRTITLRLGGRECYGAWANAGFCK